LEWAVARFFILKKNTHMSNIHQTYRQEIIDLVESVIESELMELIDVECLKMKSKWVVRIYMDKENGVTLDDCAGISNSVGDLLNVHNVPPGPYTLEISSPGLDRPLLKDEDFLKYRGSMVTVRVKEIFSGKKKFCGKLIEFIQEGEKKTLIVDEGGKLYHIPREIVSKANLEYKL
jgi:ribosome maturation factor RimP